MAREHRAMNNTTDTNQASEDELEHELDDIVHDALGEVFCYDCEHPRCLNKVKLYKTAILAIIRTEKLKLLDEVRERVVGGDEPGITNIMIAAEHVRQNKALNKLEAEL